MSAAERRASADQTPEADASSAAADRTSLPGRIWAGLAAAVVIFVLGFPLLSANVGGYSRVSGWFFPRNVPNVAVMGTALSNGLFLLGALGALAGMFLRPSPRGGGGARQRVWLACGGLVVLGVACRVETIALTKRVYARNEHVVQALYAQVRPRMTVGQLKALAKRQSPDIRIDFTSLDRYRVLPSGNASHGRCAIDFASPGLYAVTRVVAELPECSYGPEARVGNLYLIDRGKLVGSRPSGPRQGGQ